MPMPMPPPPPPLVSSTFLLGSNLILQATLSLTLILILSFFKIPIFFLRGLHTYIHPDDVNPPSNSGGGIRAAIRRPGTYDSDLDKPRKKSKDRFEFDENKAQIFRLKLNEGHLQTRIYFIEFSRAFNFTLVAIACLLLHKFLPVFKDSNSGVIVNGSLVPILLGFMGICRILLLTGWVSLERSASKKSDKQLSVLLGFLGFLIGLTIVFDVIPQWVFDFSFRSLDGFGRFSIAVFMGYIMGVLYMPAMIHARAFWLGTDQIRCNLSMISCGWIARTLFQTSYLLLVFVSTLWISPLAALLYNNNCDIRKELGYAAGFGRAEALVGNVGLSRLDFENFRLWCLLVLGVIQIVTLRPNVQMYLNEAVLCWYQRLHASKVPELDYSRAKVFLHNHFLCLVAVQFLSLPALVLLFLGLSQIDDNLFESFQFICNFLPCSAFVKEVALFMAWWVLFVWAIFTSASLALYRRGILYVS